MIIIIIIIIILPNESVKNTLAIIGALRMDCVLTLYKSIIIKHDYTINKQLINMFTNKVVKTFTAKLLKVYFYMFYTCYQNYLSNKPQTNCHPGRGVYTLTLAHFLAFISLEFQARPQCGYCCAWGVVHGTVFCLSALLALKCTKTLSVFFFF